MTDEQKQASRPLRELRRGVWMGRFVSYAGLAFVVHARLSSQGIVGSSLFLGILLWWVSDQWQLGALSRATQALMTRLNMPSGECDAEKSFWRI